MILDIIRDSSAAKGSHIFKNHQNIIHQDNDHYYFTFRILRSKNTRQKNKNIKNIME